MSQFMLICGGAVGNGVVWATLVWQTMASSHIVVLSWVVMTVLSFACMAVFGANRTDFAGGGRRLRQFVRRRYQTGRSDGCGGIRVLRA